MEYLIFSSQFLPLTRDTASHFVTGVYRLPRFSIPHTAREEEEIVALQNASLGVICDEKREREGERGGIMGRASLHRSQS